MSRPSPSPRARRTSRSRGRSDRALRRTASRRGLVAFLHVALLHAALLVCGGPWSTGAAAAERVVTVTADGVRPQVLTVDAGDTVRFVVEDASFAYRAQSTAGAWRFDSGPVALLEGDYVVPAALTAEGTYAYRVAQDAPFRGTVVVRGTGGAPGPAGPSPTVGPVPSGAGVPTGAAPSSGPAPSGATAPSSGPEPSSGSGPSAGAGSSAGAVPVPPGTPVAASPAPGTLGQRVEHRDLGLPTALAALLLVGTASLLLRTLLAEPVLSDPPARLSSDGAGPPRW